MRKISAYLLLAALTGCSGGIDTDYGQLEIVNISGTVTYDGAPLPGALVTFEAGDGTYSYGMTDGTGGYRLMFNSEKSGVLKGPKTVRIQTGVPASDEEGGNEGDDQSSAPAIRIPDVYNKASQLKVNVESSDTMNFDLKSDGSTLGAS